MSAGAAFAYTVNAVLGSGALALPQAIFRSGYVLGPVLIAVMGFLAYMTLAWHFEVQLRALSLIAAHEDRRIFISGATQSGEIQLPSKNNNNVVNVAAPGSRGSFSGSRESVNVGKTFIPHHDDPSAEGQRLISGASLLTSVAALSSKGVRWTLNSIQLPASERGPQPNYDDYPPESYAEIGLLLQLFVGRYTAFAWNICVILYVFLSLWCYAVVWSTTAMIGIPITGLTPTYLECMSSPEQPLLGDAAHRCDHAQKLFAFVFCCIVAVLMLRNWSFMDHLQKFLTGLMYTALSLICITSLIAMFQRPFPGQSAATGAANTSTTTIPPPPGYHHHSFVAQEAHLGPGITAANGKSFSDLFGATVFAMLCHSASTLILQNMPSKAVTKRVYKAAFFCISGIYIAMATSAALYMGDNTLSLATHNWANYASWGTPSVKWLGDLLGGIVLFYPMMSVTATYYVLARALANSIENMFSPESRKSFAEKFPSCGSGASAGESELHSSGGGGSLWPTQHLIRAVLTVLPCAMAVISSSYHKAVTFAGLVGFAILFFFPVVLQVRSIRLLKSLDIESRTPYDDVFSGMWVAIAMGVVSFGLMVYYFVTQIVPIF